MSRSVLARPKPHEVVADWNARRRALDGQLQEIEAAKLATDGRVERAGILKRMLRLPVGHTTAMSAHAAGAIHVEGAEAEARLRARQRWRRAAGATPRR